jgi:hypothetical protein
MKDNFLGVVEDIRTPVQKSKDWSSDEVASSFPIIWEEKTKYKFFSRRNQDGSSTCMAQSGCKMLGIENEKETGDYKELSATPVYQERSNKPGAGMFLQDCLSILSKPVACLESQVPSQNMSESQIDASYEKTKEQAITAGIYRAGGYAQIPIDIDKIAGIVSQGKGVQLIVFFEANEWWGNKVVKIINKKLDKYAIATKRHGVCAVDFTMYKGQKALVIEDSAVLENEDGQRIITEDWLLKRCYGAGYLLELENDYSIENKPHHHFEGALKFGMRGLDVKALQDILKYEKFFPAYVPSTGYFGAITAKALKEWQLSHALFDFEKEQDMRKIRFGAKSMSLMNYLYT